VKHSPSMGSGSGCRRSVGDLDDLCQLHRDDVVE
jgi:hypothetical protein